MNIGFRTWSSRLTFVPLTALLLLLLLAPPVLTPVSAQPTSFSFNFGIPSPPLTTNVASASQTVAETLVMQGDRVNLTGSGTFNTSTDVVSGGGSFTHLRSDGTVVSKGTWVVTEFVTFKLYGGSNPARQGGFLTVNIDVQASGPTGPEAFKGITMDLSCVINLPPGEPTFDSAILPELFGTPVSGTSFFSIVS